MLAGRGAVRDVESGFLHLGHVLKEREETRSAVVCMNVGFREWECMYEPLLRIKHVHTHTNLGVRRMNAINASQNYNYDYNRIQE